MDIYSFIESKDIREHLQSLNYQFTAAEAAFLVYQSENRSLPEKFAAWEEIIETMPDCSLPGSGDRMDIPSVHGFLREYVALQRRILNEFYRDGDDAVYTQDWSVSKDCASALNNMESVHFRWIKKIWFGQKRKYLQMEFDQKENPVGMLHEGLYDEESKQREESIDGAFKYMCFLFPIPFKRGDIVGKPDDFEDDFYFGPILLDCLSSWDREEMLANGFAADDPRVLEADKRVEKMKTYGTCADAALYGYTVQAIDWTEEPRVCYGNFRDYLHYERVNTPLTSFYRVLQPISSYLKGKLGLDLLINTVQFFVEESKLDEQKEHCMNTCTAESLRLAGLAASLDNSSPHRV